MYLKTYSSLITFLFLSCSKIPIAARKKVESIPTKTINKGKINKTRKKKIAIVTVIVASCLVGIAFLLYYLYRPASSEENDETFRSLFDDLDGAPTIHNGDLKNKVIRDALEDASLLILAKCTGGQHYLYNIAQEAGKKFFLGITSRLSHNKKFLLILNKHKTLNFFDIKQQKIVKEVDVVDYDLAYRFSPKDNYVCVPAYPEEMGGTYELSLYKVKELVDGRRPTSIIIESLDLNPLFSPSEEYIYAREPYQGETYKITLYHLQDDQDKEILLTSIGTEASFSQTGHYFTIENRVDKYLRIFDIPNRRWLSFEGLSMVEEEDNTKIKGTYAHLLSNEKDLLIKRKEGGSSYFTLYNIASLKLIHELKLTNEVREGYKVIDKILFIHQEREGTTYFSIYSIEDLTLSHEISLGNQRPQLVKVEINQNSLIISFIDASVQLPDDNSKGEKIKIYSIPEKKIVASYEAAKYSLLSYSIKETSLLCIQHKLPNGNKKVVIYDVEKSQEVVMKV